jgi:hypothetical protein
LSGGLKRLGFDQRRASCIESVSGRVATGTDATGVTYAPRTAQCNVGVLTPQ